MPLRPKKFAQIAESLRQYRRAELSDLASEIGGNPIDRLYVDPLESDAVLNTVLQNNTTFLVGRKGTGKSTVFAKAQLEIRKRTDAVSIYIDVKSLHELLSTSDAVVTTLGDATISEPVLRAHGLRKAFLGAVIADLISEVKKLYESRSLFERWVGKARGYKDVLQSLEKIAESVRSSKLTAEELPILRTISLRSKQAKTEKKTKGKKAKTEGALGLTGEVKGSAEVDWFDESMSDNELYKEYSDAVLRSFPFQDFLEQIRQLLTGVKLSRLFIFFDDFSELVWIDQKLFVDVILSPLNNASDERIKLKIAGYPGRIYYGKIDPGKVDTVGLDFYQLYKSSEVQASEQLAVDYLERLLRTRFEALGESMEDYFDESLPLDAYFRLLFQATLNVPRLLGYVLHNCFLDKVAKREKITSTAIRLAARKYYETVIVQYFDRMNRFALEPFDRKLDRYNQQQLMKCLVNEAKGVKRGIVTGKIGGKFFQGMSNPPVSHFAINSSMERLLSSLELNYFVTKYHEMRDKSGKDVSIFAMCLGLCESERFQWGYPKGRRDDRSYFVQRCFNYNSAIQQFLSKNQTIRCEACGACFDMDKREMLEFYKWQCPECRTGKCTIVSLSDDFRLEVEALSKETMLPTVELEILETLHEEGIPMRAMEIAALIDVTYQLVGRRTTKLHEMGLVEKNQVDNISRSAIAELAHSRYFGGEEEEPPDEE